MTPAGRLPAVALIPPACCGAGYFRRLRRALGAGVEICGVELPGRGRRYREPALTSAERALRDVQAQVPHSVGVVYGESLGAYIGLALLAERGVRTCLIAASNPAPRTRDDIDLAGIDSLDGAAAILSRLGGGPPAELGQDPAVAAQAHALIRSDLLLSQGFIELTRRLVVDGDVRVLAGSEDGGMQQPEDWQRHTRGSCSTVRLTGPHLLSGANPRGVADAVLAVLRER